jgi:phosphatidylinositol glycan class B
MLDPASPTLLHPVFADTIEQLRRIDGGFGVFRRLDNITGLRLSLTCPFHVEARMHPDLHQLRPVTVSYRINDDRMPQTQQIMLAAICLVALLLRLRVGINTTYLIHPDEMFDYLEQGFRLAFGYGTQTWTYQDGLRSYLFPALLALPMKLGSLLGPAPGSVLNAAAVFMSLMSLSVVVVAFLWGRRTAGTIGAGVTGCLAAVWFELIYFAPHALSEVMATNFLVVAAYLCPDQARMPPSAWRLRWLGVCLGLTIVIRIQLAPAVLVILLWLLIRHPWRTVLRVAMAAALPVLAAGMLDWVTYSYPFQSLFLNFWANIVGGVAHYYGGVQPFYYLVDMEIHYQNTAVRLTNGRSL